MSKFLTEQENFWAGDFGDEYIYRNNSDLLLAANLDFFSKALKSAGKLNTCFEIGANIGMNLRALKTLFPEINPFGLEINNKAVEELKKVLATENIYNMSILDYDVKKTFDLVLIKGVLIHINPNMLAKVYQKIYSAASKYILIAEYYNPSPISIGYRGHEDRLFKRDFAGEILDLYPELRLVDYGFAYHRDVKFPQDDISWFLLEK
jgi:spore coat polysaccharide biosynthesis protein SpsF